MCKNKFPQNKITAIFFLQKNHSTVEITFLHSHVVLSAFQLHVLKLKMKILSLPFERDPQKIAKINSQQEKPVFFAIAKLNSHKNLVPHGNR